MSRSKQTRNPSNKPGSRTFSAPVAIATSTPQGRRPSYKNVGGDLLVSHIEMFGTVESGAADPSGVSSVIHSWDASPGNRAMFPWLSDIADRYEKYRFERLTFRFVPRISTSVSGMIVLAFDYDANDPTDILADTDGRMTLLSHEGSVGGSVWAPLEMQVSPARLALARERFVDAGEREELVSDARFSHLGRFFAGVFGTTTNAWIGDIEVAYTIRLMISQLPVVMASSLEDPWTTWSRVPDDMGSTSTVDPTLGVHKTTTIPALGMASGYPSAQYTTEIANDVSDVVSFEEHFTKTAIPYQGIRFRKPFSGTVEIVAPLAPLSSSQPPNSTSTTYHYTVEEAPVDPIDETVTSFNKPANQVFATATVVKTGVTAASGNGVSTTAQGPYVLLNAVGTFLTDRIYRFVTLATDAVLGYASGYVLNLTRRSYNRLLHNTDLVSLSVQARSRARFLPGPPAHITLVHTFNKDGTEKSCERKGNAGSTRAKACLGPREHP